MQAMGTSGSCVMERKHGAPLDELMRWGRCPGYNTPAAGPTAKRRRRTVANAPGQRVARGSMVVVRPAAPSAAQGASSAPPEPKEAQGMQATAAAWSLWLGLVLLWMCVKEATALAAPASQPL